MVVLLGFIRVLSSRTVTVNPFTVDELLGICAEWLSRPQVSVLDHGPATFDRVRRILIENGLPGQLSTDAYIAAVAFENEAVVHTADRDFERIENLRVHNPLIESARRPARRTSHRAR